MDLNGEVLFLYPSVGNSLPTPQHTNTIGRDETDYVEDLIRPRVMALFRPTKSNDRIEEHIFDLASTCRSCPNRKLVRE